MVQNNAVVSIEKQSSSMVSKAVNWITEYIENGTIDKFTNYDYKQEIMSANLTLLDKGIVNTCSGESILTSLRDMALLKLSVSRNQCYFIPRNNKCTLMISYFGIQSLVKRRNPNLEIHCNIIHEGDEYELDYINEKDMAVVKNVKTSLENLDKPIVAAYGTIRDKSTGNLIASEIMTKRQIDVAWSKTSMKTNTVQKDFATEMAKRTLLKRLCKNYLNTTDENINPFEANAMARSIANEYENDEEIPTQEPPKGKGVERIRNRMVASLNKTTPSELKNDTSDETFVESEEIIPTEEENASTSIYDDDGIPF